MLLRHQPVQEVDVLEGQAQDLVLAELPVRGVRGDETPQLSERSVNILLPPAFPIVGGDPTDHPGTRT